mmetsp:Transcript_9587/g.21029  ORF Transcript_9587/g.21029 Transcript_9587/m.21029 type:complete len:305 (-) Transcript_9587:3867-4781(-)
MCPSSVPGIGRPCSRWWKSLFASAIPEVWKGMAWYLTNKFAEIAMLVRKTASASFPVKQIWSGKEVASWASVLVMTWPITERHPFAGKGTKLQHVRLTVPRWATTRLNFLADVVARSKANRASSLANRLLLTNVRNQSGQMPHVTRLRREKGASALVAARTTALHCWTRRESLAASRRTRASGVLEVDASLWGPTSWTRQTKCQFVEPKKAPHGQTCHSVSRQPFLLGPNLAEAARTQVTMMMTITIRMMKIQDMARESLILMMSGRRAAQHVPLEWNAPPAKSIAKLASSGLVVCPRPRVATR